MAEEQKPAKKAAKPVVKKTVVRRPVAKKAVPTVRYGRPTSTATRFLPAAKVAPPNKTRSKKRVTAPKTSRDLGKRAGVARQTGKAASAVAGGVKGVANRVGSATGSMFGAVRDYRLPRIEQTRASAIVGLLIGLITVGVTALFAMGFSQLRGTSTGGGRWGSLTVVIVAFIAFALGEYLLAKLHVRQPRVTSFLGVCLTLLAIMAFFLNVVDGVWAWLVLPLLGAAAYAIAHRAVAAADSSRTQPQ